ncbi:MAG: molybdenum cofactor guanylyltransferase [Chloroflexota bacterium]
MTGGQSRRMGRDKALLPAEGKPLMEHVASIVAPLVRELLVVGHPRAGVTIPGALFIPDDMPDHGPLGGMITGLRHTATSHAFVLAVDYPFLNVRLLGMLSDLIGQHDAVIPRNGEGSHPLQAFYARACLPKLERSLGTGDLRVHHAVAALDTRWLGEEDIEAVDRDLRTLANLNTPEQWAACGLGGP